MDRSAFQADLLKTVSPESCSTADALNNMLACILDKRVPLRHCEVRADKYEPWCPLVQTELWAAKLHKRADWREHDLATPYLLQNRFSMLQNDRSQKLFKS